MTVENGTAVPPVRRAAYRYLSVHGMVPVPLPPRSKEPNLPGWPELRPERADLAKLFTHPEANVAILLGQPSGNLVDVDLDCPEAAAAAEYLLPHTGWVSGRKSSPASHHWYRLDALPVEGLTKYRDPVQSAGGERRRMLVELRAGAGDQRLTLAPPSTHPSGEKVEWNRRVDEPGRVGAAELQRAVAKVAAAALLGRYWPRGARQDCALALAGALLRAGWRREEVSALLRAVCAAAGDEEAAKRAGVVEATAEKLERGEKVTGWPAVEECLGEHGRGLLKAVRGWLRNPRSESGKKARMPEAFRLFPAEALPEPLRSYVLQGAAALGCDPAYLALPGLVVAASLIGNTRALRLKRDWAEPPVTWGAVIGDSGTLKSPALQLVVGPLFRIQKRLLNEFREKNTAFQEEAAAHKDAARQHRRGEGGDPGPAPQPPVLRRLVCSDTTIEKLASILEDNPRGLLAARDELAGWLGSFSRYKSKGAGSDLPLWLEAHRAGAWMVDRKTGDRPTVFIPHAAVCVVGSIQSGVLARYLTPDYVEAGLLARVLLAMPPKAPKRWSEQEVHPEVSAAYDRLIEGLAALEADRDEEGDPTPFLVRLDPAAKSAWVEFYDEWAAEQSRAEGDLAAALSKLEAYCARFALVHHTVRKLAAGEDTCDPVEGASVAAGAVLTRWFAAEARRIYSALGESPEDRGVRKLVEFIRSRGGKITVFDLRHSNAARYPTPGDAATALESLVVAGLAWWQDRPATAKGGRPTRECVLLPETSCEETSETSETPETAPGGEVSDVSDVSSQVPYRFVTDRPALDTVRQALDQTDVVALDTETTGLDPTHDRVRLLSLGVDTLDGGSFAYLIDCQAVDPSPLWADLAGKELVLHNAAFDLAFLHRLGFTPAGTVHDTLLLAQILTAGSDERNTLAACCQRYLDQSLDKECQKSDWSGVLTPWQLEYAARDVLVLRPLLRALESALAAAGLDAAAEIERRCLPAVAWLARGGVPFDRPAWLSLARSAAEEAQRLRGELDGLAPARPGELCSRWNWASPAQVKQALGLAGCPVDDTTDESLARLDLPLAGLLRKYRETSKRVGTYGSNWLKNVETDGRVYPRWRQIGAASGRMSCASPNMQQIPRGVYRRCVAAPAGRVFVKADFSQVELRIACKVSGDEAMLAAYRRGEDLHTATARAVLNLTEVTKEHRQLAKALNFGLLYGMGAARFRAYARTTYGVNLTLEQAKEYRASFFQSYPGLARWHRRIAAAGCVDTRTLAGRRRLAVTRYCEKLNTPVQGTGADGLKRALALLWERRAECPGAFPVLAVHDEIVVECDESQAESATEWLRLAMLEGMAPLIEPVPLEVEVSVCRTWAGKN